jgi:hypothetical protein
VHVHAHTSISITLILFFFKMKVENPSSALKNIRTLCLSIINLLRFFLIKGIY